MSETRPPSDASSLADLHVAAADGRDVRLGDLWADGPALLVFVRHWGCTFCRAQAARLNADRSELRAAGLRPVVIGQGDAGAAARFGASQGMDIELLADSDRAAYRAAGTKMGSVIDLVGPRQWGAIFRAWRGGARQGRTEGHPAQLGGTYLVLPDGSIPWCHVSDDASDYPGPDEVLEAARRALAAVD